MPKSSRLALSAAEAFELESSVTASRLEDENRVQRWTTEHISQWELQENEEVSELQERKQGQQWGTDRIIWPLTNMV